MGNLRMIFQCLLSPRLLRVYGENTGDMYFDAGSLDRWGDRFITSLAMMLNVGIYSSPLFATLMYRKGYFSQEGIVPLMKIVSGFSIIIAASFLVRGVGRATNPTYVAFIQTLKAAEKDLNKETKKGLMKYDFEFWAWPICFKWNQNQSVKKSNVKPKDIAVSSRSALAQVVALPCDIIAFFVAHTVGVRLVYPGSIALLRYVMGPVLLKGRTQLIVEEGAERFKLQTSDNNFIDTVFVDRRRSARHSNGSTLVVCSEGNAGFYEVGIMVTALEAGYSVVGWNHPGFGGSTGMPYLTQEKNAMDVVMQFALTELNFLPENIILFGWSIGGYPSTYGAMTYPDVKGVVLDATFDDVVPLAVLRMPAALESIVKNTMRTYLNLNVFEPLSKYPGPVLLIRRSEDEIICTEENDLSSNRGNNLLVKVLQYRYPLIVGGEQLVLLNHWLSLDVNNRSSLWTKSQVDVDFCTATLSSYVAENSRAFPMLIGEDFSDELKSQITLFLVVLVVNIAVWWLYTAYLIEKIGVYSMVRLLQCTLGVKVYGGLPIKPLHSAAGTNAANAVVRSVMRGYVDHTTQTQQMA